MDKTEILHGILFRKNDELGECTLELNYDELNPNGMFARFIQWPDTYNPLADWKNGPTHVTCTLSLDYEVKIILQSELPKTSTNGLSVKLQMPVKQRIFTQILSNVYTTCKVHSIFFFPLCKMIDNTFVTQDSILGYYDADGLSSDRDSLSISVKFGTNTFSISQHYRFPSTPQQVNGHFVEKKLIKHARISVSSTANSQTEAHQMIELHEGEVSKVLRWIGFNERSNYDWFGCEHQVYRTNTESNPVQIVNKIRTYRAPATQKPPVNTHDRKLFNVFSNLIKKAEELPSDEYNKVDSILDQLELVEFPKFLVEKFVRLHSILDFIRNDNNLGRTGFSGKLRTLLDRKGIDVADIIPYIEEVVPYVEGTRYKGKRDFRFTKVRNDYIHDGFKTFAIEAEKNVIEFRVMRALVERIILADLGIDYKDTHLGLANFI